jgi:hypothetical protein
MIIVDPGLFGRMEQDLADLACRIGYAVELHQQFAVIRNLNSLLLKQ